ncbi:TonB-dependent siderophore receptor [Sphingomonas sp. So64.6b]|uniref:TonB-dependent siderophore receptor n=1 Tax=Sphingomonas sp. So64.6b TaxID=2997354 RepID=UPI00160036EE|nr:TonB-dependent siderophore receptor [Sphingomonas sp. So64.6b]QNA82795.1 TonB-dependent siderophore receptor [Sphingomonas sp. So64.6b]
MTSSKFLGLSGAVLIALTSGTAWAADGAPTGTPDGDRRDDIIVTGERAKQDAGAGTKTATPLIETPQPITILTEDMFRAQGAISISDTVRYAAGITANPYGRDTRVDSFAIRGIDALQFRDGMRDIFGSYVSTTSDPYNFSRVEVVRGPASVLFGQGSIGGIVNLVSKTPEFTTRGEIAAVYGSDNRKELLADINGPIADGLAARLVARVRDSDTFIDNVRDDRVMIAPSLRWQPGTDTDITLLGLYQNDHGGSTPQFLPIVGTLYDNPGNPRLPRTLFVGKPGHDRYDGRLLQGTAMVKQRITDQIELNLKARYIDSDVSYFTHYTNSYSNPTDPYLAGSNGRLIQLYSDDKLATLNVFTTDNNLQIKFDTGAGISHLLLVGVDYSWNRFTERYGSGVETVDLYNIDRAALSIPVIDPVAARQSQKQLGLYVQDQIRFADRVSVVLGARRDHVSSPGVPSDNATTFRAGIIGEIGAGISPFFSYTESFQPIAGFSTGGSAFKPQKGTQYEAGVKWQPDASTLVTVTGFHIRESNRPIADPANPLGQIQSGELTTKGFEVEATRTLPGNYELSVNYGYNKLETKDSPYFDYYPRHNASIWGMKTLPVSDAVSLRLGAGVRYTGNRKSVGPVWTIVTGDNTLVDALAELEWSKWRLSVNATNLFNQSYFASCLSRGDCFIGAPRNVMGTLAYHF